MLDVHQSLIAGRLQQWFLGTSAGHRSALDLPAPQARALTSVATYDGALIRIATSNQW